MDALLIFLYSVLSLLISLLISVFFWRNPRYFRPREEQEMMTTFDHLCSKALVILMFPITWMFCAYVLVLFFN